MSYLKTTLFVSLIFILIILFPGIYFQDMTDVLLSVMSKGIFTTHPVAIFNNYGSQFILSHLYAFLEGQYSFNWYDKLNVFYTFLATVNLFHYLLYNLKIKDLILKFLILFSIFIYYINDIILLSSTQTSLYLMFSGMLTLTHYLKFNSTCRERRIVIFYNIFLIFIGILIRPLCSIIIITLYLPLLLIYVYKTNRSKMKETIITILILIIFSLTFIILSYRVYNSVDKEYADFVIYKSSVFDNGQSRETLKLRNIKDSTIYNSFTNYYIPEKEYYNANYLDKLGIYKAHTPYEFIKVSINELPYKIKKAISKWEILFQQNYRWFFILFFILLLLCLSFNTNKKYFFRNLIIILWFILCLTSLSVLIKIEDRILYPSILMCFILLLETSDTYIGPAKDWFVRICMIALLLSCIFFIQNRFYEITKRQHGHDKIAKLMLDIKLHHSEKIFILDAFSLNILSSRLFYYSKNTEKIKWFSIEPGYLIFYKEYFEKQYKLTGTRNYKDLFLYASGHKNNFVFIYSGDRIKLVEEYNKNIHNINLPFMVQKQILKNVKIFSGNDYFYVYSIK